MAKLSISLLGRYEVTLDDQPLVGFESDRVRMLLAYLSVEADRAHDRLILASWLWPDQSEAAARTNLRHVLLNLRNVIGDAQASPPFLKITYQTIQWNSASDTWLDITTLSALLTLCKIHAHERLETCSDCADRLKRAIALYRGDFLAGITLPNSRVLEEWVQITQERLHRQALEALYYLAAYHEAHAQFDEAAHMARRQVELEPWREEAHRQLMRDLALAGRRSEALAQFKICRDILTKELNVEPAPETIELYERIKADQLKLSPDPTAFAASSTNAAHQPSPALNNLPHDFNAFIGRSSERAEIHARLNQSFCRLITLIGPGGSGKTRLAVAAARERLAEYADGVWFVSLVGVNEQSADTPSSTIEAIATAIAGTLGLPLASGTTPHAQLLKYLADKQMLLILDNFEHLMEGVDVVRDIVDRAPRVQVLVTSRQVLNLQREWLLEIAGLPYPASEVDQAASAEMQPSVLLFEERRRQMQPVMIDAPEERAAIRRICQLVEGMPLAIELAAALTRTARCSIIAATIADNLGELATSLRDIPPRQRSLRAVFDASWQQLTFDEQQLLARLAVFRGSFTAEAAIRIAPTTEAMLIALQDKSFLHRPHQARYTLHEVLRYFAVEKLRGLEPAAAETFARHSAYYLSRVSDYESTLGGAGSQQAVQDILSDLDNVRQAWQWAIDQPNLVLIRSSQSALFLFYRLAGLMREGLAVLARAVERLRRSIENAAEPSAEIGWALDRLLIAQCHFFRRLGEYAPALEAAREAIRLAGSVGDSVGEAGAHYVAGLVLWYQGNYAAARQHADDALRQYQHMSAQLDESRIYNLLGLIMDQQGDYAAARSYYEQALNLSRSVGDRLGESMELSNLGELYGKTGDYERERTYYIQALPMVQQSSEPRLVGQTLSDLGHNSYRLGEDALAQAYYEQALSILRDVGDRAWESLVLLRKSMLFERLAELSLAYDHCRQTLSIAQAIGQRDYEGAALAQLGRICIAQQNWDEAKTHYLEALALREALGQLHCLPELWAGLAEIAVHEGKASEARPHVDSILHYLDANPTLAGSVEPLQILLICHDVLKSLADERAADILARSHRLLQDQAARIRNDDLRQSFLNNVPIHRAVMIAWADAQPTDEIRDAHTSFEFPDI